MLDADSNAVREVAIAILYQAGQYLMQLRDPIATIVYPGHWGMFGGHLDEGETPEAAIWRELIEEIDYVPPALNLFIRDEGFGVIRHVFYGPLTVPLSNLTLREGWDLGLLSPEQIRAGEAYSAIARKICPLGTPHQTILLNFMEAQGSAMIPE